MQQYLPSLALDIFRLCIWLVILAIVVGEVGAYWGHRWSHEIPWLWRFHAIHHSAEEMDWLVNTRAHPLDMFFGRFTRFPKKYGIDMSIEPSFTGQLLQPLKWFEP